MSNVRWFKSKDAARRFAKRYSSWGFIVRIDFPDPPIQRFGHDWVARVVWLNQQPERISESLQEQFALGKLRFKQLPKPKED